MPSGSPAEPWLTSSGTSSLTAAAACSVLGTPRGATAGDTGMGGTGRAKRAQWGRGAGGVLRGCRMEGDTVGSWGHRVTVGQKMGRRLWEWGTVEPRGLWKEPEHGCEARQRQGVAVGWRQLGGRGMGGMGRQRERDVRRLWDGELGGYEIGRARGGSGVKGVTVSLGQPRTRHGAGVARLTGCGREPWLEALEEAKPLSLWGGGCGTGRLMTWPWGGSGPWTQVALWGCAPTSQLVPMAQPPQGAYPTQNLQPIRSR